jgi:glycine betaine/proline transport system substrate-binding protein
MLSEVTRAARAKKPIVFVAWEPHPMNIQMPLTYLAGGDDVFGPNLGEAKVYTLVATDYLERCPNAGKLVQQLSFTTDIENRLMQPIMDKVVPAVAAKEFLKKNPQMLDKWLAGVKTVDNKDGLPAVKTYLGL